MSGTDSFPANSLYEQSGAAGTAASAYELFKKNYGLVAPAVLLLILQIVLYFAMVWVTGTLLSYGYYFAVQYIFDPIFSFANGVLIMFFSALTVAQGKKLITTGQSSFGMGAEITRSVKKTIIFLSLLFGVLQALWSFTGLASSLLDALTLMPILIALAGAFWGEESGARLRASMHYLFLWLSQEPISVLVYFIACFFAGFYVLELIALPMAALLGIAFSLAPEETHRSTVAQTKESAGKGNAKSEDEEISYIEAEHREGRIDDNTYKELLKKYKKKDTDR